MLQLFLKDISFLYELCRRISIHYLLPGASREAVPTCTSELGFIKSLKFAEWEESLLICVTVASFVDSRNSFPLRTQCLHFSKIAAFFYFIILVAMFNEVGTGIP
jgi:hypothetical protein